MKVLVTGAGGFLGDAVVRGLRADGHAVVATMRRATGAALSTPAGARASDTHVADLATDPIDHLPQDCEAVVHCAARASPWGPREAFWRDNVTATERLLEVARRSGSVRRFVLVSSPSIYFNGRDQLNRDEAFVPPVRWPNAYAETKWAAEERVRQYPELGPVVLRPRAIFGPGDRTILPRIVAVARGGVFPLMRNGECVTDVTYIDNAVAAVRCALVAPRTAEGKAFNITNGEPLTMGALLRDLFAVLQMEVRLVPVPRAPLLWAAALSEWVSHRRVGEPEPRLTRYGVGLLGYSQTLCIDAARQSLGYQSKVSIAEGLRRYAQSLRKCA